jgi:hypothetical protein
MPAEPWQGLHGKCAVVFRPPPSQAGGAAAAFVKDLQAHNTAGGGVVVPDSTGYPRSDGAQHKDRMVWVTGDATAALQGQLESKGEKVSPGAVEGQGFALLVRALVAVLPVESKLALLRADGKAQMTAEVRAFGKAPTFSQQTEEKTSGCFCCRKRETTISYMEKVISDPCSFGALVAISEGLLTGP